MPTAISCFINYINYSTNQLDLASLELIAQGFQASNNGIDEKWTVNGGTDEIILKNNHAWGTADSECITTQIGVFLEEGMGMGVW